MKKVIQILVIAVIAMSVSSCHSIDGSGDGEHEVFYYGNISNIKLVPDVDCGWIPIQIDADKDGETDFNVILANSFIPKLKGLKGKAVVLRIVSRYNDPNWYVVDVITQPDLTDYIDLEENSDTLGVELK